MMIVQYWAVVLNLVATSSYTVLRNYGTEPNKHVDEVSHETAQPRAKCGNKLASKLSRKPSRMEQQRTNVETGSSKWS